MAEDMAPLSVSEKIKERSTSGRRSPRAFTRMNIFPATEDDGIDRIPPPAGLGHLQPTEETLEEKYHLGVSGGSGDDKLPPGCFYPSVENDRETGQIIRTMPENMFGAFILIWMNKAGDDDAHVLWWMCRTGMPIALLFTNLAQAMFAYFLFKVVHHQHADDEELSDSCARGTEALKVLALFAFICQCFADLQQTYGMHLWLTMFTDSEHHQKLTVQRWLDTSNERVLGTRVYRPVTGVTRFARAVFYLFVLVPKAALALWVLLAGSGLVLHAKSDYDLVLNAVAAAFVLDLDEMAYRVFVTQILKTMASCPPLGVTQAEIERRFHRYVTTSDYGVCLAGAALLALFCALRGFWC